MVNKPTNKQRAVLGDPSRRQRHPGAQASPHSSGNHTPVGHVNATPNLPSHIPIECNSIGGVIDSIRETSGLPHRPTYDIDSSDIAYSAAWTPRLSRNDASSLPASTLLLMMRAWDLETLKVLRPGRTTVGFDTAVFDFAEKHTNPSKLKHLHLNMRFGYRAGLSKYLKSNSAANLETLRLKTNTDIQSILIEALVTGTQLPTLRTLILRVKKFAPSQLLDALEARHRSLGARDMLHNVEIAAPLAQATIDRARRMGITLTEVAW
ncbi:hypothetical protein EV714DRAFT_269377 [Schizophyllum commune]